MKKQKKRKIGFILLGLGIGAIATGSILGAILSVYPKKQNNSIEKENNTVQLDNQLKLVIKPKYLDKLNKLKDYSESNQKLLQDLYNDVNKFFWNWPNDKSK